MLAVKHCHVLASKAPQTVELPPPCFTVCLSFCSWGITFGLCQTCIFQIKKLIITHLSSVLECKGFVLTGQYVVSF